jgi:two-component system sensor histidine kinase HydH
MDPWDRTCCREIALRVCVARRSVSVPDRRGEPAPSKLVFAGTGGGGAGTSSATEGYVPVSSPCSTRWCRRTTVSSAEPFGRWSEQLAHDLGNPLAALKGALQFSIEERRAGRSLDAHDDYLRLMLEQCDRLQNVVQSCRRLARVEPVLELASLNEVVVRVLSLQGFAASPGVSLEQNLNAGLPACWIDPDLVATASQNIVQNAYEALPNGGRVVVRTARGGGASSTLVLSVEDDGPRIDARLAERVTDAFVTTKRGGSGLGLAFAARVAKAHQGGLELDTALGRGTIVRLVFPAGSDALTPFGRDE